jgi:hypothetical protein
MKHVFLHTRKQRALSWGLIGLGLLLMWLAPAGGEPIWVPFLIAGAVVEVIGIALRHQERKQGARGGSQ